MDGDHFSEEQAGYRVLNGRRDARAQLGDAALG
jgi:hypothetical protein